MSEDKKKGLGRRDFLKAAATTPVVGAFAYSARSKEKHDKAARRRILDQAEVTAGEHPVLNRKKKKLKFGPGANSAINVGFIGIGDRGKSMMRNCALVPPGESPPEGLQPLNVRCTAVCDLFKPNVEWAVKASGGTAKVYSSYQELLASSDVDAVVVATTDQWHAPVATAAARAGKHVYVEKCMTYDIAEAFELRQAVRENGVVLQLGHQNRNSSHYDTAMEVISKGMLGHVSLIHCYSNRNSNNGAWFRGIPADHGPMNSSAGARNVDWEQYLSNREMRPYDPNRFFNWQCFREYSTGLPGQLASHAMDIICMVMQLGIPATAVASAGIYYYKDFTYHVTADGKLLGTDEPLPPGAVPRPDVPLLKREVPDMFHVTYEWPDKGLTVIYNATLSNAFSRGQIYLGDEASMDLTNGVDIFADRSSKRYAEMLKSGEVRPDEPMISYQDVAGKGMEAVTSATSQWAISRGLVYTYRDGKRVSTANMHLKNWMDHIRASDTDTLCNMDDGFIESVTIHMANLSYQKGCRVRWDDKEEKLYCDSVQGEKVLAARGADLIKGSSAG
ncbi:MAG: Gfo/Idh/MocA family oxidoreductase [Gemmatimonadota bacterium]|nr:Gfo/Idh/MocA family oxidoreductase [Gemmatimonadota bacterium]